MIHSQWNIHPNLLVLNCPTSTFLSKVYVLLMSHLVTNSKYHSSGIHLLIQKYSENIPPLIPPNIIAVIKKIYMKETSTLYVLLIYYQQPKLKINDLLIYYQQLKLKINGLLIYYQQPKFKINQINQYFQLVRARIESLQKNENIAALELSILVLQQRLDILNIIFS